MSKTPPAVLETDPRFQSFSEGDDSKKWQYNNLTLKLLHVSDEIGTGFFMRAFPWQLAAPIIKMEEALIEEGKLSNLSRELLERFAPIAKEALYAAQSLWKEY